MKFLMYNNQTRFLWGRSS